MIIGITGGTGCGKTTLLKELEGLGAKIIDCDALYHRLLATDPSLTAAIEARFPGTVEEGILQRKKLGALVFSDPEALRDLNAITHAAIKDAVLCELSCQPPLAAIDAVALFESGLDRLCDVTVAVTAPTEDRIARLMARDGITADYARARITAQPSAQWFREKCDYVLENTGDLPTFQRECLAFFRCLVIMK